MLFLSRCLPSPMVYLADALIAATVVQMGETLLTANDKHYKFVPTMQCKRFEPEAKE